MIQKPICFLALLISLLFSVPLQAQQRIPLEVLPSGHIVVKAAINGVEGRFIFDTGGGINLLTQKFAQRVKGLQKQDGRLTAFRAIGDRLDVELYTAKSITVGAFVANSTTLTVYEGELGGLDGLLALTAFQRQPFTLDLHNKQLVLETPASLAKRRKSDNVIPLQVGNAHGQTLDISAYFRVNDKLTLLFPLDTGAGKGVYRINSAFASQLGIDTAALAPTNRIVRASEFSPNNRNVIYRATLDKLTPQAIPSLQLTKAPVQLVNGLIYDGIIPIDWLGEQLTIDIPHQVLLIN
ncbi:retropepsin-like aspartic protease [Hymenobacter cavernae]|uniref:Aspartyl protease n=1 Tax=Hymenobacter cavernae TaxID=2044852 RepID=A0ABQ1UF38_9BACT|nr:retropepsin-like aspartic protease [Hymenobacter cavernae]GGF15236.1 hypothetical protein GCM10011383_28120 [Hymenobacter cavernae]